ncbi:stress-activated protein kinase JNK-like [Toxorhynchites rutilus septentrionalis]|uniref:stress-activated protein kinase JNK-like n=1 Tax=Toxorhynchites rutilus septentrionalis TaxID=329112 RepID=UPI00247A33F2|nr:stress-activated protein kinase JNK-like [Toxorhynchites rutilus septentrionalis]XP_055645285.1 stress-activated protein kinase JNK-like [Toxorhynchites rutilus septentrionalis]XP_055645286.1 stress-activated protein kinase JNK-like [Toxorhynchites rutilus septentrionalis]
MDPHPSQPTEPNLSSDGNTEFTVPGRFQNLFPIGIGAQGAVCAALDTVTGMPVAIKKLSRPFQDVTHAKRAYREIKLMRLVDHPFVIKLLYAYSPQTTLDTFRDIYLFTERMDSNLSNVIGNRLDHERLSFLVYQMLCGIKYLHSAGIIHRDLKPTNIVVRADCSLKILDFGLARSVGTNFMMTQYVVTRYYRAPEVILNMDYDTKVDIWAIGCIMAELITGQVLFPGTDHVDQWNKIIATLGTPSAQLIARTNHSARRYIETLPVHPKPPFEQLFPESAFLVSEGSSSAVLNNSSARNMLERMLEIDPYERISVVEALDHPYVNMWFQEDEVNRPAPVPYDHALDEQELSIDEWKALLFREIQEIQRQTLGMVTDN